jgi:N-acetylglucosamine-6-phosphate deacetylase
MLTRIAEDFGFTIATFQHVLEGYKVAERLAEHGAGASTFSDWWAYKYEVVDAIGYNGTLMANAGVNVSFNSDSDELARRMNLEAAKAVKYGGLEEAEALKFVTINPAKQLKIDKYVGSLEEGKDADFAIWSGHPLSSYSICEQTWLDGKQYFSIEQDKFLRERDSKIRNDLIQKILLSPEHGGKKMKANGRSGNRFESCDAFNSYTFEGEER